MNIFDIAEQRERYMEALYKDLARKTSQEGLKNIFSMLAVEESKHTGAVNEMKTENSHLEYQDILEETRKTLLDMKKTKSSFTVDMDQIELYKKVRDLEEESELLYRTHAERMENSALKKVLFELAAEERKHFVAMDEIVEFVQRPDYWLENAEFSNLDKY